MNQELVTGPNLLFYVILVTLLSAIALVVWQLDRLRKSRVRARISRARLPWRSRR